MDDFTPRSIAKDVAKSVVGMNVTKYTKEALAEHSRFEKDDIPVRITAGLIGAYAAHKCAPITDKLVDKTADFIIAKREERKAKKETEK